MKKGDKVFVKNMTGGPYSIIESNNFKITEWQVPISVDGYVCTVHRAMITDIEPAEPEIEEGRLVWISNKFAIVRFESGKYDVRKVEPVHRRLDEWSEQEKQNFSMSLAEYCCGNITAEDVLKVAYYNITGEDHP